MGAPIFSYWHLGDVIDVTEEPLKTVDFSFYPEFLRYHNRFLCRPRLYGVGNDNEGGFMFLYLRP